MAYNLREKVYLIGYCSNQMIATTNLPTIRQVLAVLSYNLRRVSSTLHDSVKLTIEECLIIWKKALIPTQRIDKCIAKLVAEHNRWRQMQKSASRNSDFQMNKVKIYGESIDKLFDIASANALDIIENDNDKHFLLDQRGNLLSIIKGFIILVLVFNTSHLLYRFIIFCLFKMLKNT